MKLNPENIKLRWRELAHGPVDRYTRGLVAERNYGGGNGTHDAVIDAFCEEITRVFNEALSAATPDKLEQLLDLLITTRMDPAKPRPDDQALVHEIPDYGDHMTWDAFKEAVDDGFFMDDDGHGILASATKASATRINPSDVDDLYEKPDWATHVVWFNK